MIDTETTTYRQLADALQGLIEGGTLQAGDRMPSLRGLARDYRVSVTTAMSAYEVLENRGLVEARARSGFFVIPRISTADRLPGRPDANSRPRSIEKPGIYERVMAAVNDPAIIPLGCAVPSDELIPATRLASVSNAVLRKHGAGAFRYSVNPGRIELRHQVAKRMLGAGAVVGHEDIITTTGATESICVALAAVTRPGDVVAVEMPTYFGILRILEDLGLRVVEVPTCPTDGIDLDRLDEVLSQHPVKACMVQPNFQNPTGSVMSEANRSRLMKLADRHDFILIEDDLYGELVYSGSRPTSLLALDRNGRVIHCGGVSKSLSPGLRVGWLASRAFREPLMKAKNVRFTFNPTLSELTVAAFLADGGYDRHLRRIRQLFQNQLMRMREQIFQAFPEGTKVNSPCGGFVLWVQLPKAFDAERLAEDALDHGISVVPGTIFSASRGLRNCLRLSCGARFTPRIEHAVKVIGRLCAGQTGEWTA